MSAASYEPRARFIRYGLRSDLAIPLRQIASAASRATPVARRQAGTQRYCEAGVPNVCIGLSPPSQVPDLFGAARPIERMYLGIDEPRRFIGALRERLDPRSSADGVQSIPR